MDEVRVALLAFFRQQRPAGLDEQKILQSTDLYRDGFLDSLSTLNLIRVLEQQFQIRFGPFLVTRKNFSSLAAISDLVQATASRR